MKILEQKRLLGVLALLILLGSASWLYWKNSTSNQTYQNFSKAEKNWQIERVKNAFEFTHTKILGEVISLKKAFVSSRRGGVIQDVYIDVGDEVYAGQVVASLLPEGVAGQDQALIAQAQARIDQAQSALELAEQVKTDSVAVSVKNWRQATIAAQTRTVTDDSSVEQLEAEKQEAKIISDQIWENLKVILYGRSNNGSIVGTFNNTIQEGLVKNAAQEIERMKQAGSFGENKTIVSHLKHLEEFLKEVENLYSTAQPYNGLSEIQINTNLKTLQNEQLRLSSIRQSILALEEKAQTANKSVDSGEIGIEQAKETLDLTETQQNERTTQAQRNLDLAVAQYNTVLNQFSQNQIISQHSGIVAHRMIDVGQTIGSNSLLFELEDSNTSLSQTNNFQIQVHIPESLWGSLSLGEVVKMNLPYKSEEWEARVVSISQKIDQKMGGFLTILEVIPKEVVEEFESNDAEMIFTPEISFKTPTLADEMTTYIYVKSDDDIWTVPSLALKKRGNQYFLWKWEDEQPKQIEIKVVAEDGEFTQVSSQELTAEDNIVSNPSVSLFKKSE